MVLFKMSLISAEEPWFFFSFSVDRSFVKYSKHKGK